jgi:hypothetical protein
MVVVARSYVQGISGPSGASGAYTLGAGVTIPASGGVTVTLSAGVLADSQSVTVQVNGIIGSLSRSGSTYTFTRTASGSTSAVPTGGVLVATVAQVGLESESVGLTTSAGAVGLKPTGLDIDLSGRKVFDAEVRDGKYSVVVYPDGTREYPDGLVVRDSNGKALLYVSPNGVYVADIFTSFLRSVPTPNSLGAVFAIQDNTGKVMWAIDSNGRSVNVTTPDQLVDRDGVQLVVDRSLNPCALKRIQGLQSSTVVAKDGIALVEAGNQEVTYLAWEAGKQKLFRNSYSGGAEWYAGYVPDLFKKTYWGYISGGQSLSEGQGSTARTLTQLAGNKMFSQGLHPASGASLTTLVAAVEGTVERGLVASTADVSLHARALAVNNTDANKREIRFILGAVGYGARELKYLKKSPTIDGSETTSYTELIAQVTAARNLAAAEGWGYELLAIPWTHGESDDWGSRTSPFYYDQLLDHWRNINTDVKAITGQARDVIFIMSQTSAWHRSGFPVTPYTAIEIYKLFKDFPDRFVLAGAKYWLPYSDAIAHLTTDGYNQLNGLYAQALVETCLIGKPFKPVYPTKIVRVGTELQVTFNVPVKPLVIDTSEVSVVTNYGFEYVNTGGTAVTISNVRVKPDGVTVLMDLATATAGKLRYAYTGTSGAAPGASTGVRGNIRDSANYANAYNLTIRNWCVHFEESVS